MSDRPRVSVIIATWNAGDVLTACLDSVARQEVQGGHETIVVDNASTDSTAEVLGGYVDRVRVIANTRNAFYAGANNQAASVARGRVLFFLNPDTELLTGDVLENVASAAEEPAVGIAGPMLVNPDGSLQPSCAADPSVWRALLVGVGLHRLVPDRARAVLVPDHWSHDRAVNTGWLMGAALGIRADLFHSVGGFWGTLYAEEQDLARRVRARGLRVRFVPSARVMHIGNHSVSKLWSDPERAANVAAAELAFLRTHYGPLRAAAIRLITTLSYGGRASSLAILRQTRRAAIYRRMTQVYLRGDRAMRATAEDDAPA